MAEVKTVNGMTREGMLAFLQNNPAVLAEGIDPQQVVSDLFAASIKTEAIEAVKAKKSEDSPIEEEVFVTETFEFAETLAAFVKITPGNPNGQQERSKVDRQMIEVKTPNGRFVGHLYLDA